jgi:hypothetical protein
LATAYALSVPVRGPYHAPRDHVKVVLRSIGVVLLVSPLYLRRRTLTAAGSRLFVEFMSPLVLIDAPARSSIKQFIYTSARYEKESQLFDLIPR